MVQAMVVSTQPDAVEAGAVVLHNGGNAVDAAVTCAFVQSVVDPLNCGIAGFGSMHLYLPSHGVHELIDFHAKSPAAVTAHMWADRLEGEAPDGASFVLAGRVNELGYQSISTPGTLKAFAEAHRRYGSRPWSELLAPAIAFAADGYILNAGVHADWAITSEPGRLPFFDRLAYSKSGRRFYCDSSGAPRPVGSLIRNSDMAATLRLVAEQGSEAFYEGEIADRIDADMRVNNGLLSIDDLRGYRVDVTEPLWGSYRGRRVATNQLPGGGLMVLEMLNILEHFDLAALGHNSPEYMRVVSEAMKIATIDKDAYLGDPRFVDVPVSRLTDKAYAATHAAAIERGEKAHVKRLPKFESRCTTHLTVVDGAGGIVSLTHSLGYMSGVITDGLGFMYNGCMAAFDPRPGRAGSIAPGKARFSGISPTIVFAGERPILALGAPGGTQIPMGVLQVTLNHLDFGMPIHEAVLAPRFSATNDAIMVTARVPRYVTAELEQQGYRIERSPYSFDIASVQAVSISADGVLRGGADVSYGGGLALGV